MSLSRFVLRLLASPSATRALRPRRMRRIPGIESLEVRVLPAATPGIDLTPTVVDAPAVVARGSSVSVLTRVDNTGANASGSFTVRYYLSTDGNVTTSDTLLKTVTRTTIAGSGFQQWSEAVTVPASLATGNYTIGVIVDPTNAIAEFNESNNVAADSTPISVALPTDLSIATLDGPSSGLSGSSVSITTRVNNAGSGISPGFTIRYYLSSDPNVTTSDTLLKTVTRSGVYAGWYQQWSEAVTLPAGVSGTWYVGAIVDPLNAIPETNEANNVRVDTAPIVLSNIDLDPFRVDAPDSAVRGSTISVSSGVANLGTTASPSYTVRYYLSTDATINTSDTLLKTVTRTGITGQSTDEWIESIALSSTLAARTYYVGMMVDPTNAILETNETNNIQADSAVIAIGLPPSIDLDPGLVDGPASATIGSTFSVYTDIDNKGTAASGTYTVNYYLSTDATITTTDILLKSVVRSSIAGSSDQKWVETVTLPTNLSLTNYYLGVLVDPANTIVETTETNNAQADARLITILSTAKAGFQIQLTYSGLTTSQIAIFEAAKQRWEELITGDLPDGTYNGIVIDDVLLEASSVAIDGPGKILGQAGPTHIRSGSALPLRGIMQFDTADLANMEANGQLYSVILHEMGHILGIGTVWSNLGLLTGAGSANPQFLGPRAVLEYNALFGVSSTSVPVEGNNSPQGSRDSHWRESVFANELMTPYISGAVNPLSRVSVASLADLGYVVNMAAADSFTPTSSGLSLARSLSGGSGTSILAGLSQAAVSLFGATPNAGAATAPAFGTLPPQISHAIESLSETIEQNLANSNLPDTAADLALNTLAFVEDVWEKVEPAIAAKFGATGAPPFTATQLVERIEAIFAGLKRGEIDFDPS